MTVSENEKARRERLSEGDRYALEERDDRIRQALAAIGVKLDIIATNVIRFHDERGSRPFSTPIAVERRGGVIDMSNGDVTFGVHNADEAATLAALQRDVARMRGLRLMEILSEEWTIDRLDQGQRELLAAAMHRLSAHVDGAIAVAVDAIIAAPDDEKRVRAVLNDAPFRHLALAVAKERVREIAGMEAKAAALPDEPDEVFFKCLRCGEEFKQERALRRHEYEGCARAAYLDAIEEAAPCTCEAPRERGPERGGAIDGHEGPCLSRAAAFYEAR